MLTICWRSSAFTATVVFWKILMEVFTVPAPWWPRWCRKCLCDWQKLEKTWILWDAAMFLTWCSNFVQTWMKKNGIQLLFYFVILVNVVVLSKRMSFFSSLGQVFGLKFSRIAVSRKSLQMVSKTDLITNGLIFRFFDGICRFSLISYLYGLKYARIAQTRFASDDIKSFR